MGKKSGYYVDVNCIDDSEDKNYEDFLNLLELFNKDNTKSIYDVFEDKGYKNDLRSNEEKNSKINDVFSISQNIEKNDLDKNAIGKKVTAYDLAEEIKRKIKFIVYEERLYIYDEKYGYYKEVIDKMVENIIRGMLRNDIKRVVNSSLLTETIKWIKSSKELRGKIKTNKNYINFKDGYYDIITNRFYANNRESLYFNYYVNAKFNKRIVDGYYFNLYIDNITNGSYRLKMLIQEILGLTISNIRNVKKAIFIVGKANSGKSTFLELINNIIGKDFTSNLSLIDLNDKFRIAELVDKRVNVCGEVSELTLKRLDIFKMVTGKDSIMAERKGKDPFVFRNSATLIFAGNYLPELGVTDISNAFFERLIIVPFNNKISKEDMDINLMDKLLREKKFIIDFAIDGLNRLIDNNYEFTECEEVNDITNNYLYENASFQMFIKEKCILDTSYKEASCVLIDMYEEYCINKGVNRISTKLFHKYMKLLDGVKYIRFRCELGNVYGYKGIRLKY